MVQQQGRRGSLGGNRTVRFIQDRIEKDAWLEEFFPKQMEVYHNAIEQTKEQLLKQINMI